MSLAEHVKEFRNRALVAFAAIIVLSVVGWVQFDRVYRWLVHPLVATAADRGISPDKVALNFAGSAVSDAFGIKLKVALWLGLLLASPVWLWQIWGFLAPGLTKKEKRISRIVVAAAVPLFLLGCWVSTFALPNAVRFLLGVTPGDAVNLPDANTYIAFVTRFGTAELPTPETVLQDGDILHVLARTLDLVEVERILAGARVDDAVSRDALRNPDALDDVVARAREE